ncbi:type II secretion system F family protein [Xanthomonas hortorum pv. pelargonii]|nr:type II secretion system F family protein [Xanthomonas hortorum pv. pelargonii]
MPLYRYKALDAHGEMLDGQMEAASDAEVVLRLQEQGHLPVETRLATGESDSPSLRMLLRKKPFDNAALVQFTQQLSTLIGAGQPLDRALSIPMDLPEDEKSRRVIGDVRDTVRGGAPLSSALERQHGLFSKLYINMVRAGEAGGSMQDTLQRLADYLERSRARGKVINALIYPAILLAVVGRALLFLLGYVVPQFAQMYESLDVALPWFTQAVLSVGLLVRDWWVVLIVVPGVLGLWLDRKRRNAAFRAALDEWLLRQKVVGSLIARLETARLTRTLGTLLRNGVPLLAAIGIARNVMSNLALVEDVDAAADDVKNGHGLAMSLARGKRFPRLALQMIQVGEESGALDTMLLKTADTFELETAQAIDRALAALVPLITLVLASVVGLVIISVLVPLYDLTNAIG